MGFFTHVHELRGWQLRRHCGHRLLERAGAMTNLPNLTLLVPDQQVPARWPDHLQRAGYTTVLSEVDGLLDGYIGDSEGKVYVSEQRGPDVRHSESPIAGLRVVMVYTGKSKSADDGSDLALLNRVVDALESAGATRLLRDSAPPT